MPNYILRVKRNDLVRMRPGEEYDKAEIKRRFKLYYEKEPTRALLGDESTC